MPRCQGFEVKNTTTSPLDALPIKASGSCKTQDVSPEHFLLRMEQVLIGWPRTSIWEYGCIGVMDSGCRGSGAM